MAAETLHGFPARYHRRLPDGRIECELCPRRCRLQDGQRGLCFVRGRAGDDLVLTTYGRSSGYCIDPIEKKPLNHFLPGTPVLSFGTAGCNLSCRFCQNWDISKSRETETLSDAAPPEAIALAARELSCRSVAFTYNDPVIFLEYLVDTAVACRELGVATVAVTAGYVEPAPLREMAAHLDAANVDLKAFTESFYARLCSGALAPVLSTLETLVHESDVWVEITTLLIPGENDSDAEIRDASRWVARELGTGIPWHFTAFHPDYRMQSKEHTPLATVRRAREIAMSEGHRFVYTGNVDDVAGGTTRCFGCGEALVVRDRYRIDRYRLDERGGCASCGATLPGVFEPSPGTWGPRRQPVRLADFSGA